MDVSRMRELHAAGLVQHGGATGEVDKPGCVESIVEGAETAVYYIELPDETLALAAYLLIKTVQFHCFVDGNKRLAWLAAVDVIRDHHDLDIAASDDDAEAIVLLVATSKTTGLTDTEVFDRVIGFLADHLGSP